MATKANAGAANLNPANRKGIVGVRKKVTKSLLEWLEEVVDTNKADFVATLATMAASDPEKYLKTMVDLYKIIVPKQVQADINMGGNGGAPVINFNFGDSQKQVEAQPPQQLQTLAPEPLKLQFPQPKITDAEVIDEYKK